MDFKLNDWIRLKDGSIKQLVQKLNIHSNAHQTRFVDDFDVNFLKQEKAVLWEPEINEWCWFYHYNCSPILARYKNYDGEEYEALEYSNSINNTRIERTSFYSFCKPFIGVLPQ